MYLSHKRSSYVPKVHRFSLISFVAASMLATTLSAEINTTDIERLLIDQEQNARSGFQLAGYASFGYSNSDATNSTFDSVQFAPIFHYVYSDILQFEGEVELTVDEAGET